jgi:phage tail protein X
MSDRNQAGFLTSGVCVLSSEGDTLDLVCWRHFGKTAAVTEAALALNPHLPPLGEIIPTGSLVVLPGATLAPITKRVQLWD